MRTLRTATLPSSPMSLTFFTRSLRRSYTMQAGKQLSKQTRRQAGEQAIKQISRQAGQPAGWQAHRRFKHTQWRSCTAHRRRYGRALSTLQTALAVQTNAICKTFGTQLPHPSYHRTLVHVLHTAWHVHTAFSTCACGAHNKQCRHRLADNPYRNVICPSTWLVLRHTRMQHVTILACVMGGIMSRIFSPSLFGLMPISAS